MINKLAFHKKITTLNFLVIFLMILITQKYGYLKNETKDHTLLLLRWMSHLGMLIRITNLVKWIYNENINTNYENNKDENKSLFVIG